MAAVEEKVKQIIVEQLQVDEAEVTPGASFQEDLGADSLDVVELVMQFEEAFDIEIPDEDAEKIKTVKDAVDYIEKTPESGQVAMDASESMKQQPSRRRVVVTGLGLICGVGSTVRKSGTVCSPAAAEWQKSRRSTSPAIPCGSPRK